MYDKKKGKKMQSLAERRSAQLKCINSFNSGSRIIITKGVHTFTKIFTNHAIST